MHYLRLVLLFLFVGFSNLSFAGSWNAIENLWDLKDVNRDSGRNDGDTLVWDEVTELYVHQAGSGGGGGGSVYVNTAEVTDPDFTDSSDITFSVDGSTVTGLTIEDSTQRLNVVEGSMTWQKLYPYETDWLFTSAGIIDEGRFAVAKDTANYAWFNFKLKNVTSPTEPLVITGGYGIDGDTGLSVDMIDNTGGTIILAPDHVVPITISGASVITGDITDIQADLLIINQGVQKSSLLVPHTTDL
jgi:hypothetical protein